MASPESENQPKPPLLVDLDSDSSLSLRHAKWNEALSFAVPGLLKGLHAENPVLENALWCTLGIATPGERVVSLSVNYQNTKSNKERQLDVRILVPEASKVDVINDTTARMGDQFQLIGAETWHATEARMPWGSVHNGSRLEEYKKVDVNGNEWIVIPL